MGRESFYNPPFNPRVALTPGIRFGPYEITTPINPRDFTVQLAPGACAKVTLAMKRYANPPTAKVRGVQIGANKTPV
jgi:hypothetical protein